MLENFREIYNNEVSNGCYGSFETLILNSLDMRKFVYEVCKACMADYIITALEAEKRKL